MKQHIIILLIFFISSCVYSQTISFHDVPVGNELPKDTRYGYTNYYITAFTKDAINNDVATGYEFEIRITGLPLVANTLVELVITRVGILPYPDVIIYKGNHTTTIDNINETFNSSTLSYGTDSINNNTGIFKVEINITGNPVPITFGDNYLVIEKTKDVNIPLPAGVPYDFQIHYVDQFFEGRSGDINPYLTDISNALNASWQKFIIDWELAKGLPSDIPKNDDNTYDIYISGYSLATAPHHFHMGASDAARSNIIDYIIPTRTDINDRSIWIDCNPINAFNADPTLINLDELLYEVIPHEFYHGIQWSHTSFKTDAVGSSNNISKMQWWYEGQAKALETVLMFDPNYNTHTTNIVYSTIGNGNLTHDFSYEYYTRDFINNYLDVNYSPRFIQDITLPDNGYYFSLLWRHIYEHHFLTDVSVKDRLNFFRETSTTHTSFSNLPLGIKNSIMNAGFTAVPGNFANFDEALTSFAEKVYFHDKDWLHDDWVDDNGVPKSNWDDPNNNNFYTAISNYTSPAAVEATGTAASDITSTIDKSFAFRPHTYSFPSNGGYEVTFENDMDNDNSIVSATAYLVELDEIVYKKEFTLPAGANSVTLDDICVTDYITQELVILTTRLDHFDGAKTGDYQFSNVMQAPPDESFSASKTSAKTDETITFTGTSSSSQDSWYWEFGDGTTSTLQNPTHAYATSGSYSIKLTFTKGLYSYTVYKESYIRVVPEAPTEANQNGSCSIGQRTGMKLDYQYAIIFKENGLYTVQVAHTYIGTRHYYGHYDNDLKIGFKVQVVNSANEVLFEKETTIAHGDEYCLEYFKEICISDYTDQRIVITVKEISTILGRSKFQVNTSRQSTFNDVNFDAIVGSSNDKPIVQFRGLNPEGTYKWNWDFGDGEISQEQNPSHEYSTPGIYTPKLAIEYCGVSSVKKEKKNYIGIIPPYITKVEIIQNDSKFWYKRIYNHNTKKIDFTNVSISGSYIQEGEDVLVNVTTSLPMLYLKWALEDETGKVSILETIPKPVGVDTKNWSFKIPAGSEKLGARLNTLHFSGAGYGHINFSSLITEMEPNTALVIFDEIGSGLTSVGDFEAGADDNYLFYVKSNTTASDLYGLKIINSCNVKRIIVTNNDNELIKVEFGDNTITNIPPHSINEHIYTDSNVSYRIKILQNGIVVKAMQVVFHQF